MKHLPLLLLCTSALYLTSCADDEPSQPQRSAGTTGSHHRGDDEDGDHDEPSGRKPRIGMSQAQVRAQYGEPKDISHSSRGETWHYWFNRGHMFIPYNFGYKPKTATFEFNAAGFLTDYDYNE